jgi:hypothetical protein
LSAHNLGALAQAGFAQEGPVAQKVGGLHKKPGQSAGLFY